MNVLVLGGTKYFGKRLVEILLKHGEKVTVISRRDIDIEFMGKVKFRKADRDNRRELANALANEKFDVVFDQICYASNSAQLLLDRTAGKVGKYVLTSTQSVYEKSGVVVESDFDPTTASIMFGDRSDFPFPEKYGEGKRMSEAVYFQNAMVPVAALRIPVVFGPDDYTMRLKNLVQKVKKGEPILITNHDARFSLIHAEDAAKTLYKLATTNVVGPLNVASVDTYSIGQLVSLIETITQGKATIVSSGDTELHNRLAGDETRTMDVTKAVGLGFQTTKAQDWLPQLIRSFI